MGAAFLLGWTHAGLNLHAAADTTRAAVPAPRSASATPARQSLGSTATPVTDPCCGSVLRPDQVSWVLETPTKRYYFDSQECLESFYQKSRQEAEPEELPLPAETTSLPAPEPTATTKTAPHERALPRVTSTPSAAPSGARTSTASASRAQARKATPAPATSDEEPPSVNEPYPGGHVRVPEN